MLEILRKIDDVTEYTSKIKDSNIGFVPTMGALHNGHASLIRSSIKQCDKTIVSIFVNLKQFSVNEDFYKYPRDINKDIEFLSKENVDAVFLPDDNEIYPENFSTKIHMSGPAKGLESITRPHFFEGVATIVTKLFMITKPDKAYFGLKDYQQFCVIKRLVEDLYLPIEIIGVPTAREDNGLALSSRNSYLSKEERLKATVLYKTLCDISEDIKNKKPIEEIYESAKGKLLNNGFNKIDYIKICQDDTLDENIKNKRKLRILVAAYLGKTRLIDNMACEL